MEVRPYQACEFNEAYALLSEAFPPAELFEAELFEARLLDKRCEALWLWENGVRAGFSVAWRLPNFYFPEYLAIHSALRGQGIGGAWMRCLRERTETVAFEVERPSSEQAGRRIGLYERCGWTLHPVNYYMPAVQRGTRPTPMHLMSNQLRPSQAELAAWINDLYAFTYQSYLAWDENKDLPEPSHMALSLENHEDL